MFEKMDSPINKKSVANEDSGSKSAKGSLNDVVAAIIFGVPVLLRILQETNMYNMEELQRYFDAIQK